MQLRKCVWFLLRFQAVCCTWALLGCFCWIRPQSGRPTTARPCSPNARPMLAQGLACARPRSTMLDPCSPSVWPAFYQKLIQVGEVPRKLSECALSVLEWPGLRRKGQTFRQTGRFERDLFRICSGTCFLDMFWRGHAIMFRIRLSCTYVCFFVALIEN